MNTTYPFSRDTYRGILERALSLGYTIGGFRDFEPPSPGRPALLLRHDLDHSILSAVHIARIEAELGVGATYFVQVACDFYNLLSSQSRAWIAHIVSLGHEIGLHYESPRYAGPRGPERLDLDLALLEDIAGHPITSASQHIPIDSAHIDLSRRIEREAYEPRFTSGDMSYISDSLMRWRQATPQDLLDQRRAFQLLTHPMKWVRHFSDMDEALDHALEASQRQLTLLTADIKARYRDLLDRREALDEAFRAAQKRREGMA